MTTRFPRRSPDRGFSLTGVLCSVAVALTVTGTSLTGVNLARDLVRADAEAERVGRALSLAAETARRGGQPIDLSVAADQLRAESPDRAGARARTVVTLGGGFRFQPFDVPPSSRVAGRPIASVSTLAFDASGRLVREATPTADLAIYLGKPGSPLSSRALVVSPDGPSVTIYRWSGAEWRSR